MNILVRRFRRWRHAHRCEACGRRYMWTHAKCPKFPKTIEEAQKEINAQHNLRVDAVVMSPHYLKEAEQRAKLDYETFSKEPVLPHNEITCCPECTDNDKEITNG